MEATMTQLTVSATDLEPGDQWVSYTGTVRIDGVSYLPPTEPVWPRGAVRIHGCILRGAGIGRRMRWMFQPDQLLDIERAGRAS
jgi:hypothetical protein